MYISTHIKNVTEICLKTHMSFRLKYALYMFSDRFLPAILSFLPAQKITQERQEPTSPNCIYLFYFFSLGFYGSFEGTFAYPFENSQNVIYPDKFQLYLCQFQVIVEVEQKILK